MSRIICGWYTPDYAKWAEGLAASCKKHGERFDLVAVDKNGDSWETETQRKPNMIRRAMRAHAGQDLIIFVDVDATIQSPLDELELYLHGDVAFYGRAKMRTRNHLYFRSGTVLVRPRSAAEPFVGAWQRIAEASPPGTVDQDSLITAMELSPDTTFQMLPLEYCATVYDIGKGLIKQRDVKILHESASAETPELKEGWFSKRRRRLGSWLMEGAT